jgi:hypothetical protein
MRKYLRFTFFISDFLHVPNNTLMMNIGTVFKTHQRANDVFIYTA